MKHSASLIGKIISIASCVSAQVPFRTAKASKSNNVDTTDAMSMMSIETKAFKGKSQHELDSKTAKIFKAKSSKKKHKLCWVGCEPYVWENYPTLGYNKWLAMVEEMGENCEVIVHVGDTNSGGQTPCMYDKMSQPLKTLREIGLKNKIPILYTTGDNENNDCWKACTGRPSSDLPLFPSDVCSTSTARPFLIEQAGLNTGYDVTGQFKLENHVKEGIIPTTDKPFSCDFDKYIEFEDYAVATTEITGSQLYLNDEGDTYPNRDDYDPLEDRYAYWLNAVLCFEDWIMYTAQKTKDSGKRVLFFGNQAHFWATDEEGSVEGPNLLEIGDYYNAENLCAMTERDLGRCIEYPYQPVYEGFTKMALAYPEMIFYVFVADFHYMDMIRANSSYDRRVDKPDEPIESYHNLMFVQGESGSRGLVVYQSLDVDPDEFWPVQMKQLWSKEAFETEPHGIQFYPSKRTDPPCWQVVGGEWKMTNVTCNEPEFMLESDEL